MPARSTAHVRQLRVITDIDLQTVQELLGHKTVTVT
jgi:hypothetical protein